MKKRLLALLLADAVSVGLVACGNSGDEGSTNIPADEETTPVTDGTGEPSVEGKTVKVGMVCIDDENNQGYAYNFMRAVEETTAQLTEQGTTVKWSYKKNILGDSDCEGANIELVEDKCDIIINNSYGFGPFMLKVALDYPKIESVSCTNQASAVDDLNNTHNTFANIYKGRYLADVVGGMELQQMVDEGIIATEEAVIGYVTTLPSAEVISGYIAFYQSTKSVCPSVTMKVEYANSWSNTPQEAAVASTLADEGCVLTSRHSDNTTSTTSTQDVGVFCYGYNNDMTGVTPEAGSVSCRVNWMPYFIYTISAVANDESFDQDWAAGYTDGSVKLTGLNTAITTPDAEEALEKAEVDLTGGLHVFAGSLSGHPVQNPDGEIWGVGEGEFFPEFDLSQEGSLSAPQFCYVIDNITKE